MYVDLLKVQNEVTDMKWIIKIFKTNPLLSWEVSQKKKKKNLKQINISIKIKLPIHYIQ